MVRALHTPLGIQPQAAMLADLDLGQVGQAGDTELEKEKAIIATARSIPGVTLVSTVSRTPMSGCFGMAAYNVSRRMKELSIRVALDVRKSQVMSVTVGRPIVLPGWDWCWVGVALVVIMVVIGYLTVIDMTASSASVSMT
jgi:hypothetical protein